MARYMRTTSPTSSAKPGSGATSTPWGSRICLYSILNSAAVRIRELCQGLAASASCTVAPREITLGLHLGEPAGGAPKLALQSVAAIQRRRRGGRGHQDLDAVVVNRIDQH